MSQVNDVIVDLGQEEVALNFEDVYCFETGDFVYKGFRLGRANKYEIMIYKFSDDYENCHKENLKVEEILEIWEGAENE